MVVARFHVSCQSPGGRRDQGVGKQIERDRQCVGRLRVLADSPRRRDEFAIEGVGASPGIVPDTKAASSRRPSTAAVRDTRSVEWRGTRGDQVRPVVAPG